MSKSSMLYSTLTFAIAGILTAVRDGKTIHPTIPNASVTADRSNVHGVSGFRKDKSDDATFEMEVASLRDLMGFTTVVGYDKKGNVVENLSDAIRFWIPKVPAFTNDASGITPKA